MPLAIVPGLGGGDFTVLKRGLGFQEATGVKRLRRAVRNSGPQFRGLGKLTVRMPSAKGAFEFPINHRPHRLARAFRVVLDAFAVGNAPPEVLCDLKLGVGVPSLRESVQQSVHHCGTGAQDEPKTPSAQLGNFNCRQWGKTIVVVHILKGHTSQVRSLAYSPDGQRIVTGSYDRTVRLWNAANGQETLTLRNDSRMVSSVAFSTDGQIIASGAADGSGTVKLWSAAPPP